MKKNNMKKTLLTLAVTIVVALYGYVENASGPSKTAIEHPASGNSALQAAYANRQSDIQVQGHGTVIKTLPDDNKGSRHQRFILKLPSGQKILVAHNIDLSKKITSLQKGDTVEFNGEYEYNAKGGVLHWTHHDPRGRHIDGWLKHEGKTYH